MKQYLWLACNLNNVLCELSEINKFLILGAFLNALSLSLNCEIGYVIRIGIFENKIIFNSKINILLELLTDAVSKMISIIKSILAYVFDRTFEIWLMALDKCTSNEANVLKLLI